MNNTETIYLNETIHITDENVDEFVKEFNETVTDEERKALENQAYINKNIFKKTSQAKYLIKNASFYENLADNILFSYYMKHPFSSSFDKKDKKMYIINLICPGNIPSFSMVGIKSLDEFTQLVLASGKKILIEENIDRDLSDEEFNSRLDKAREIANKYKD